MILTENGGPAWRQTTFFPFMHAARFGRGAVLRLGPDGPSYEVPDEGAVPALEAAAVLDGGALTLFAVNRGGTALALEAVLRELDGVRLSEHLVLCDADLDATNSAAQPDRVVPSQGEGRDGRERNAAGRASAALVERAAAAAAGLNRAALTRRTDRRPAAGARRAARA